MSNSKTLDIQHFADVFGALSNPNRLKIFLRLVSCCEPGSVCDMETGMRACVGELGKDLGIAPSTVSHHIKELNQAGLINMERRGQSIECWIDPKTLITLSGFFTQERKRV